MKQKIETKEWGRKGKREAEGKSEIERGDRREGGQHKIGRGV